ncbi:MAG: endopeptidase La [Bacillota bacterium]
MQKNSSIIIPLLPMKGLTIFPNMAMSFPVMKKSSLEALEIAEHSVDGRLFIVTQRDDDVMEPEEEDLYTIGTISVIKQILTLPGNLTHVVAEGKQRAILKSVKNTKGVLYGRITPIDEDVFFETNDYTKATMRLALEQYTEYLRFIKNPTAMEVLEDARETHFPGELADYIAAGMELSTTMKQEILSMLHAEERLDFVLEQLSEERNILQLKEEIKGKTKTRVDKQQRNYYLREEMKVIQEELGDRESLVAECEEFENQLTKKNPPEQTKEAIKKEINKLRKTSSASPESNVSRNYIETLLALPYNEMTKENTNLTAAQKILDSDHYGLEKVKERIMEFLAVRMNAPNETPTILCFVGPPGIGKTSIAKSIAKSLNRKYVRMSLGGVKDESEIRGHRKTYVGAMTGRILNSMKQAKVVNPLILLDEIDKLSSTHTGDPASALLEVLDLEQNATFRDHFAEVPYDLSKVLFMCTANTLDSIPRPLLDRMEIITLNSYTHVEKFHIAKNHLIKKQRDLHGLKAKELKFSDTGIEAMIEMYTKEAGVRQLERTIGKVCRKVVLDMMTNETKTTTVKKQNLETFLGGKKFTPDEIFKEPQVGIVRGLAWTSVGGTTLSIEINTMSGEGKFNFTGNVGKVMSESAEVALAYIRSQSERLDLPEDFYKTTDIHVHIPQGATPKDGPSAGITMTTAMLSAFTKKKIRNDVAMTGEVTIRGQVLPIGGLQEKVLAAKKIGIKHVILPHQNEQDLLEIKEEIREGMDFTLAKTMEDVLPIALGEGEQVWK